MGNLVENTGQNNSDQLYSNINQLTQLLDTADQNNRSGNIDNSIKATISTVANIAISQVQGQLQSSSQLSKTDVASLLSRIQTLERKAWSTDNESVAQDLGRLRQTINEKLQSL
jgi:acetate kinase